PEGDYVHFSLLDEVARAAPEKRARAGVFAGDERGDYAARETPLPSPGCPFDVVRVEIPSAVTTSRAELNTITATLFDPKSPNGAAVVILPIWKGPEHGLEELVARHLAGCGFRALVMPLPGQWERTPKGFSSGSYTVSSDIRQTRDA